MLSRSLFQDAWPSVLAEFLRKWTAKVCLCFTSRLRYMDVLCYKECHSNIYKKNKSFVEVACSVALGPRDYQGVK